MNIIYSLKVNSKFQILNLSAAIIAIFLYVDPENVDCRATISLPILQVGAAFLTIFSAVLFYVSAIYSKFCPSVISQCKIRKEEQKVLKIKANIS